MFKYIYNSWCAVWSDQNRRQCLKFSMCSVCTSNVWSAGSPIYLFSSVSCVCLLCVSTAVSLLHISLRLLPLSTVFSVSSLSLSLCLFLSVFPLCPFPFPLSLPLYLSDVSTLFIFLRVPFESFPPLSIYMSTICLSSSLCPSIFGY
jgi:hypothetical protein